MENTKFTYNEWDFGQVVALVVKAPRGYQGIISTPFSYFASSLRGSREEAVRSLCRHLKWATKGKLTLTGLRNLMRK